MNIHTKELCEKLLLCKFSVDEIHNLLREYIPDLDWATNPDVQASHWCVEDVEACIEYAGEDIENYNKDEFVYVLGEFTHFLQSDYGMGALFQFIHLARREDANEE